MKPQEENTFYDFWGRTMVSTFHYGSYYRITWYAFYLELAIAQSPYLPLHQGIDRIHEDSIKKCN